MRKDGSNNGTSKIRKRMMQNTIQRTKSMITTVLSLQAVILVAAVILRRKILVTIAIILLAAVEVDATRRMAAMHGYFCVHKT